MLTASPDPNDETMTLVLSLFAEVIAQKAALRRMQSLLLHVRAEGRETLRSALADADLNHDLAALSRLLPFPDVESSTVRDYATLFLHHLHSTEYRAH